MALGGKGQVVEVMALAVVVVVKNSTVKSTNVSLSIFSRETLVIVCFVLCLIN